MLGLQHPVSGEAMSWFRRRRPIWRVDARAAVWADRPAND
jgi:hypothetical protein